MNVWSDTPTPLCIYGVQTNNFSSALHTFMGDFAQTACPRACCHLAIALSISTLERKILRISVYELPMLLKMSAQDIRQMLANRLNSVFYLLLSFTLPILQSLLVPKRLKFTHLHFPPHSVFVFLMILRRNSDHFFTLHQAGDLYKGYTECLFSVRYEISPYIQHDRKFSQPTFKYLTAVYFLRALNNGSI